MTWEEQFNIWAIPPSKTEQEKCSNAESGVKDALANEPALNIHSVRAFAQGSYANRTNVKAESDVDICVLTTDSFFFKLPDGYSPAHFGIVTPATYTYQQYRGDIRSALVRRFGAAAIREGSKAFDVHENSYRVEADVVPCFEYRWYREGGTPLEGTAFQTKSGTLIVNWPQQNYDNGVKKNEATGQHFKPMVRILKSLRTEMAGQGSALAESMPSFLIESLLWNVPNEGFANPSYEADVRWCLAYIFNGTIDSFGSMLWTEVNGIKSIFESGQPWTRDQVHAFAAAAWDHVGFTNAVAAR